MILQDFDVNIKNNPDDITGALDLIFNLMRGVVEAMKSIKLFANVSLFDFSIVLAVMSIVIVYLINIAKRPSVETSRQERYRKGVAEQNKRMRDFSDWWDTLG